MKQTFTETEDFKAINEAQRMLKDNGFSYGSMQRDEPIGIMYGDYDIAKWRNLSSVDRAQLHGTITGNKRNGPVVVEIFPSSPKQLEAQFPTPKETAK